MDCSQRLAGRNSKHYRSKRKRSSAHSRLVARTTGESNMWHRRGSSLGFGESVKRGAQTRRPSASRCPGGLALSRGCWEMGNVPYGLSGVKQMLDMKTTYALN
ncbi:hypothetical protein DPEC_G00319350 [Dallia pectoralis]|uniref:Uncharacterized protein n=1 Tax=Dallia pectoralis TaxID=75939 RepID=A0ACC2F9R6_DALPE|nr:hypothetical protein DPEC_G00319350 [Dallia pectoralis]